MAYDTRSCTVFLSSDPREDCKVLYCYNLPFSAGATTDNLPPGVLYRVVATYKYDAEDTDELSFEKGEIINVVPYDDPETQVSNLPCSN